MGISAKELQNIVNMCNRTRCQFCREICPTYGFYKWETQAPRGRMNTAWNLLNGMLNYSERARDIIYSCELCSQCKETCPNGVDVPEVMLALRHEINTRHPHLLPAAAADLSSNVKHHGDIFGAPVKERTSWSTGVKFSKNNERVFF
ncbi:MAG: 4Fe-4S dicluster domain-containing protein, partial [Candidatus Bathyarchaeia archaeon]